MTSASAALLTAAQPKLEAAAMLHASGMHGDAASRAYYAAFHAVSALHLTAGNSFSSHAQVIGRFNKDFVRTGLFDPGVGMGMPTYGRCRHGMPTYGDVA